MELLSQYFSQFVYYLGHVDVFLEMIFATYGTWIYLVLFLIIFCETGLVVTPFLPGDSLLFTTGAICAGGGLDPVSMIAVLSAAAILGDNTNYWIGRVVGPAVFSREDSRFLNKKHLTRTHEFYEKHGGKTIIIARFMPIIRTFAPFVAGIGKMNYAKFLGFSLGGGFFWISCFIGLGYAIGNMPWVKRYFSVVIYAIILLSITPAIVEVIRSRRAARSAR